MMVHFAQATLVFRFFSSQHRDAMVSTPNWMSICQTTSRWCPAVTRWTSWHGGETRGTVIENPAVSDWFFYYRVQEFIKAYYVGVLGVTDYWLQFEWQPRSSPHVHGLAWLPNAPNVERLLSSPDNIPDAVKEQVIKYADSLVSTCNPAVLPDGSNIDDAPAPKTDPHICMETLRTWIKTLLIW